MPHFPASLSLRRLLFASGVALVMTGLLRAEAQSAAGTQVMRAPKEYLPPAATPKPRPTGGAHPWSSSAGLLDLNTASFDALKALPGMGPEYARRVIAARPYHAKNQLLTRGVLPATTYAGLRDLVVAHRAAAARPVPSGAGSAGTP